jgi:hypothetical protein
VYGPLTPVEAHVLQFAKEHRKIQQHGQPDDDQVHQGRTACTHTVWQYFLLR